MNEIRETEIRALRDLLASEGWQLFGGQVRDQWQGERFVGRMKVAARAIPGGATQESVRELFAAREAIEGVLAWPEQRRKKLEADAAADLAASAETVRRA